MERGRGEGGVSVLEGGIDGRRVVMGRSVVLVAGRGLALMVVVVARSRWNMVDKTFCVINERT